MKHLIFGIIACSLLLCSCHENLEKRAQREAREYTEKYCPTPVQNYTRTDSVAFDVKTKIYNILVLVRTQSPLKGKSFLLVRSEGSIVLNIGKKSLAYLVAV